MNYRAFKQHVLNTYEPVLALEHIFPLRVRKRIATILDIFIWIAVFAAGAVLAAEQDVLPESLSQAEVLVPFSGLIYGVLALLVALRIPFFLLSAFFYSHYFKALDTTLHEHGRGEPVHVSFEVAQILYYTPDADLTRGFAISSLGGQVLARCGIFEKERKALLTTQRAHITADSLEAEFQEDIRLSDYATLLFDADEALAQFLFSRELQRDDFIGAARWVERQGTQEARHIRFWSRDNLGRIPGIGKAWSYGQAYTLKRYGTDVRETPVYATSANATVIGEHELELLETTLVRAHDANAILVGEEGVGKMDIVARLARRIEHGGSLPPIEHKQVFVLDGDGLIANTKEKGIFEEEFRKLLNEAVHAGNIILVIKDLSGFIASARSLGSDIVSLLEPYLASPGIQIVATSGQGSFHELIEPDTRLMRRLETIRIEHTDESSTLRILEDAAFEAELHSGVFFTYPALVAIAESAGRYFPDGVMPDKAIDLLDEVVPAVVEQGKLVITQSEIMDLVESKTGVPVSGVKEEEKEKLLNLEAHLHERIVGQDEAVQAIAHAMQRARSGMRSQDRPMGSFLFLGPTGVGKTETAKVLARVFFGSQDNMLRLNMSEYSADNAVSRLLGSFETGKQGTLVSMLRAQQYGVLLLDEFEKTNSEVLDLFLQIFDEGEFSDAHGKKVNARDIIFIATSNAGSDLIWNYFQEGMNVSDKRDELINTIIERGIFKPELLNRFDSTVVFHPLSEEHTRKIARLMLGEVQERLRSKGVELVITDTLLDILVEKGYNPEFGARPMSRAITEIVEQTIAEKMLRGEIKNGEKVELTTDDLGSAPQ